MKKLLKKYLPQKLYGFLKLQKFNIILTITNILFLIYYFFIAFYSRLVFDSYNMMKQIQEMGIFGYIGDIYNTTSGRFVYFFIHAIVHSIIDLTGTYFYWPIIFLMFGVLSIFLVLMKTIKPFSSWTSINIAFLIFNIFIITSFDFGTFFWLPATQYYVMPIFLLLALYTINFSLERKLNYIILLILGIILGGIQETFTPFCYLFFVINLFFYFRLNNFSIKDTFNDNHIKYLIFTMAVALIAFFIVIISPGNHAQLASNSDYRPAIGIHAWLLRSVKIFVLYFYFMAFRIPYFLFLSVVFAYLGFKLRSQFVFEKKYFKNIKVFIPFYLFYIWVSTLPNAYLLPEIGLFRTYTHAIYFTIIGLSVFSFLFGLENIHTANSKLQTVLIIVATLMVAGLIFNICYDVPKAKEYAESDKKRIDYLLQLKAAKNKDLVAVEPLKIPYTVTFKYIVLEIMGKKNNFRPVPFYTSEFESTIEGRNNQAIMNYYNLGYPVILKVPYKKNQIVNAK